MPNTNSAKKRLRQNEVIRMRNKAITSALKTQVKKVVSACDAGDVSAAEAEYPKAAKALDQAGSKNIIHKNAAARKKSRLQHLIKKAKT